MFQWRERGGKEGKGRERGKREGRGKRGYVRAEMAMRAARTPWAGEHESTSLCEVKERIRLTPTRARTARKSSAPGARSVSIASAVVSRSDVADAIPLANIRSTSSIPT